VTSSDTSRARHRLVEPVRRPALLPRSATVVAATVGAVLALGAQERTHVPAPRHPDAPAPSVSALQPVIPAPREDSRAPIDAGWIDTVPAGVTGRAIAGAHASGTASMRALDALRAADVAGPRTP
jgi:hypothetical protein